jgi:hypothetical protein
MMKTRPYSVVGHPRTGFSLLISVITEVMALHHYDLNPKSYLPSTFQKFESRINSRLREIFRKYECKDQSLWNPNFAVALGGPNWIDSEGNLCVRKYLGIKGAGDVTIIIKLPFESTYNQTVPHSHGPLQPWIERDTILFCSARSPAATITSAVLSINALTSEYLQRYYSSLSLAEENKIREDLALAKMTNKKFFNAMIGPMKRAFVELESLKHHAHIMRWEDLILYPERTIIQIAQAMNCPITQRESEQIWQKLSYRNLTQSHKHNYRAAGAKVHNHHAYLGEWHIHRLIEEGFDDISSALSLEQPSEIKLTKKNTFQLKLEKYINRDEEYVYAEDRELFWFSFQKSNIDFKQFPNFKTFDWRDFSQVERTNINNDQLISDLSDVFETETKILWDKAESSPFHLFKTFWRR